MGSVMSLCEVCTVLYADSRRTRNRSSRYVQSNPLGQHHFQTLTLMTDQEIPRIPNLDLAQQLFLLSNPKLVELHSDAGQRLLEGIKADSESQTTSRQLSLLNQKWLHSTATSKRNVS